MAIIRFLFVGLMLTDFVGNVFSGMNVRQTNYTVYSHYRRKRGLIFENGGNHKLVIGPIIAIPFEDPVPWRSMICGYNLHIGEYPLPTSPTYPWDKWETIYARSQTTSHPQPDESRAIMYLALENFLEKTQGNGRECLLRSLCENAQVHRHMDIFGEILNVILTPGHENLDLAYREAYEMGKSGVDCIHYYSHCPKGQHFFDQFIEEDV